MVSGVEGRDSIQGQGTGSAAVNRVRDRRQRQAVAAATLEGWGISPFGVEQPPGHRPDFVEEVESCRGLGFVNGSSLGEESEMGVDLFCRSVCDAPVVHSISADPAVTFYGQR